MGRHHKFKTAEEMELKINEYFRECDEHTLTIIKKSKDGKIEEIIKPDPQPYTVPGLAVFLGYASRFSIQDLKEHKKFSQVIKQALARIENQRLQQALTRKRSEPVSIFDLKCNFGYMEPQYAQKIEISGPGGGPIALTALPPQPESLAEWERMVIESRKAKQIEDKAKLASNQKNDS